MSARSVRLVRKGDVIDYTSPGSRRKNTETVVGVDVVFTLANGETVSVEAGEEVEVHPPEDLKAVAEQLAELEADSEE